MNTYQDVQAIADLIAGHCPARCTPSAACRAEHWTAAGQILAGIAEAIAEQGPIIFADQVQEITRNYRRVSHTGTVVAGDQPHTVLDGYTTSSYPQLLEQQRIVALPWEPWDGQQ